MSKYKVYEMEDKVTQTGKALKKLVLQGEGKQYPEKNVTMWSNHPLFPTIAVGQTVDVEIETKDSTSPNPHGGFYKNKTVLNPGSASVAAAPVLQNPTGVAEIKNLIQFTVLARLDRLEYLLEKLAGMEPEEKKYEYPKMTPENDASGLEEKSVMDESNPF